MTTFIFSDNLCGQGIYATLYSRDYFLNFTSPFSYIVVTRCDDTGIINISLHLFYVQNVCQNLHLHQ